MAWKFSGELSVSKQIADRLRSDILNGKYPPGGQFPTVRSLALEASVNPNTMQKAMALLEEEGLVCSHSTTGRFVTEDLALLEEQRRALQELFLKGALKEAKALGITGEQMKNFIDQHYKEQEEET